MEVHIECYLAHDNTLTIKSVVATLNKRPRGSEMLLARYFNVNLAETEGDRRREDVSAGMATEGLEDMLVHFLTRRRS